MKSSFALTIALLIAVGSVGCAHRQMRNALHRGAPCGATPAPSTLPVISDVTTYSPTCGWADPGCPTCGANQGLPVMVDGGYPADGGVVLPEPAE
jgi:hypothetical protein